MARAKSLNATMFQIQLNGAWTDYTADEDKILKRAYLAGFRNANYQLRGQKYAVDFRSMVQKNEKTSKERAIRPPHRWKAPPAPITTPGPTTCIKVPPSTAGTTIQVPHPRDKSSFISVAVPASAKAGQAMLVPVPEIGAPSHPEESPPTPLTPAPPAPPAGAPDVPVPSAPPAPAAEKKKGWSTGAKVATGVAGAAAVGAAVVGGAVLGEHIAEEGWDATMADLGEWATDAGEAAAVGAEAAVDWVGDAADTAGEFIMDLF